jgi:hypothetical protein
MERKIFLWGKFLKELGECPIALLSFSSYG